MTLAAYVGERVEVLFDPRDQVEIRVYHAGEFICRALCPEHVDAPGLSDIAAARRQQKQVLKAQIGQGKTPQNEAPRRTKFILYANED